MKVWNEAERDAWLKPIYDRGQLTALEEEFKGMYPTLVEQARQRRVDPFAFLRSIPLEESQAWFNEIRGGSMHAGPANAAGNPAHEQRPPTAYAPPPSGPHTPQAMAAPAHTPLEDRIGRYRILTEIGSGGMGRTVLGYDDQLRRSVVIKTLHNAQDKELRLRFAREAEALAKVQDENVVHVYEVEKKGTLPYIAMEHIPGARDLNKHIYQELWRDPDRWTTTAQILRGVSLGLAAAHKKKVIHRDLKPANVLLTPDGKPKVIDFGLAKDLIADQEEDMKLTVDGSLLGTPDYMAPEQMLGLTSEVDESSDVYGLGAILYEALTRSRPYTGSRYEVATKITSLDVVPPSPRTIDSGVPIELELIALKALRKEKADRYESAQALADDLQRYIDGEPILAMPEGLGRRTVRAVKTHKAPILASLLAAVGLYAGIANYRARGLELDATRANEARASAETARARAEADAATARAQAETNRVNGEYNILIRQAREAAAAKRWDEADRRFRAARALRETDPDPTIRDLENLINGDLTLRIVPPQGARNITWKITEVTRNGEVAVDASLESAPQNVTLRRGKFYNLEVESPGCIAYRHIFRMGEQESITLRTEPLIAGSVTVNRRARPLPEFYLIANDQRDFYFSAVPISIGHYVLSLMDKEIDLRSGNPLVPQLVPRAGESMPFTHVTLPQAKAYCDWLTEKLQQNGLGQYRARLPTPLEVELAAAPHSGRTYPWGEELNPQTSEGQITNVHSAERLQAAIDGNDIVSLLRPCTTPDNLLGVALSRAKHWGNIRRLAVEGDRVYAVGASANDNHESLHRFRRDDSGTWLYRREITANQPDAFTGFSVVVERR